MLWKKLQVAKIRNSQETSSWSLFFFIAHKRHGSQVFSSLLVWVQCCICCSLELLGSSGQFPMLELVDVPHLVVCSRLPGFINPKRLLNWGYHWSIRLWGEYQYPPKKPWLIPGLTFDHHQLWTKSSTQVDAGDFLWRDYSSCCRLNASSKWWKNWLLTVIHGH